MLNKVNVDYRKNAKGIKTPTLLYLADREIEITEVLDRWYAEKRDYYKVQGIEGCVYILCHHSKQDSWEVTMFERRDSIQEEEEHVFRHSFRGKV